MTATASSVYRPGALIIGERLANDPLLRKVLSPVCQLLEASDYAGALRNVVGQARAIQVAIVDPSVIDALSVQELQKYRKSMRVIFAKPESGLNAAVEQARALIALQAT